LFYSLVVSSTKLNAAYLVMDLTIW